jgi:hypothetical protein
MRQSATSGASELDPISLQAILDLFERERFQSAHLEIGTAAGGTLKSMLKWYSNKGDIPEFHVVDPMTYFPNQLKIVKENIEKADLSLEGVFFHVGTSKEKYHLASEVVTSFDFILIDGSHKAHHVVWDLLWLSKLAIGGVVVFDDYQSGFNGVDLVVDRFLARRNDFKVIDQKGRALFVKRVGLSKRAMVSWKDIVLAKIMTPVFQIKASGRKRLHRFFS